MNAPIWGISGQGRSGKDTIAEHLVKAHGFVRVGWADPMKRFVQEVFDFSDEQVWGNRKEEPDVRYLRWVSIQGSDPELQVAVPEYLTPRYALQTIGTQWGRDCYPATWIEYGLRVAHRILDEGWWYTAEGGPRHIHGGYSQYTGVVISDCRFRNELEAVKKAGGVVVRVRRPGADGKIGIVGHASEVEQQSIPDAFFDHVIENDGTLDNLYRKVDAAVGRCREKSTTGTD